MKIRKQKRERLASPGELVAKRFFRNRLAVLGMVMLLAMFAFSFLGGGLSPYGEDEQFYTHVQQDKQFASVVRNNEFRYLIPEGQIFEPLLQSRFLLAVSQESTGFEYEGIPYELRREGEDLWTVFRGETLLAAAHKDIVSPLGDPLPFAVEFGALKAYANGETAFSAGEGEYSLTEDGTIRMEDGIVGYISRLHAAPVEQGVVLSRIFCTEVEQAINSGAAAFSAEGVDYTISYQPDTNSWSVIQSRETYVYDRYAAPSGDHWLGTDGNGMDMLTRLMYGGRVSLIIGFLVVFIAAALGVILGGAAGYFGGWVDLLVMRVVDVFYCIPSMPIIIILGAAMDAMQVEPRMRMVWLMLTLGFLSWPGIARLVRGQILSLREQEFMTAAEACGIRVSRRIFRHLVPNVIPQLIVSCTMSLGSTIITEATLSYLGLGVKFPYASWGNIISDVNNAFVMTNYWFVWIPAGVCLLVSVLGFNFVGDGLRDAFDPRMKR